MKNIHIKELSYSQDKDERTRRGGERMFIKIIGKSKAIKDLERAENLIREAHDILWRLPSEMELEVSDGNNEVTDSVQDNQ